MESISQSEEFFQLQSINYPNHRIRHQDFRVKVTKLINDSDFLDGAWKIVPGLADPSLITLESINNPGHYLRHTGFEIWLHKSDGTPGFEQDATFRIVPGLAHQDWISFESLNYPGHHIRNTGFLLYLHKSDGDDYYNYDSTFKIFNQIPKFDERDLGLVKLASPGNLDQVIHAKHSHLHFATLEGDANDSHSLWRIVQGLSDSDPVFVSFESHAKRGWYICHRDFELVVEKIGDGLELNPENATFKKVPGLENPSLLSFESVNFPGHFIHHKHDGKLGIRMYEDNDEFNRHATFQIVDVEGTISKKFEKTEPPKFEFKAESQFLNIEPHNFPGYKLRHQSFRAKITKINNDLDVNDSTWKFVPGLADPNLVSFESKNYPGYYLRHRNYELWLDKFDDSELEHKDATFRVVQGLADNDIGCVSFESLNYPGYYLRHSNYLLFLNKLDEGLDATLYELFLNDATFRI